MATKLKTNAANEMARRMADHRVKTLRQRFATIVKKAGDTPTTYRKLHKALGGSIHNIRRIGRALIDSGAIAAYVGGDTGLGEKKYAVQADCKAALDRAINRQPA